KSGGKKSLDHFCQAFYAGKGGMPAVKAYQFDELVETLNAVVPHDWRGFLERRIDAIDDQGGDGPTDGIARSGWKVVYRDKPGALFKARDADESGANASCSIGLIVTDAGKVLDVIPG